MKILLSLLSGIAILYGGMIQETPTSPVEPITTVKPLAEVYIGIGGAKCPCNNDNINIGIHGGIIRKISDMGYLGISSLLMRNYYELTAYYQTPTLYGLGGLVGYTKNSNCDGFNYGVSYNYEKLRFEYWYNTMTLNASYKLKI